MKTFSKIIETVTKPIYQTTMIMAPIPSEIKPNFQECYKALQVLIEYLPKLNIMDSEDPEYKVMYVKYHETLKKFMENPPMLPEILSKSTSVKEISSDDLVLDQCDYICAVDHCNIYPYAGHGVCKKHECIEYGCFSRRDTHEYCYNHLCKYIEKSPIEYECSEIKNHLEDGCEKHKDISEMPFDEYVVVPKPLPEVPELIPYKIKCEMVYVNCKKYPVLKSQRFCKDHTCIENKCSKGSFNTEYCCDHVCKYKYGNIACILKKSDKSKYCEKHACSHGECPESINNVNYTTCFNHRCMYGSINGKREPSCMNMRMDDKTGYCESHVCSYEECKNEMYSYHNGKKMCKEHLPGPSCIVCEKRIYKDKKNDANTVANLQENLHYECACDVQTCANPKDARYNGFGEKHKDFTPLVI